MLSSNNSSTATALWASADVQTPVGTTSGKDTHQTLWLWSLPPGLGYPRPFKEESQCADTLPGVCFRRYLPKLKGFPSRYIYEPWNAPESVQKAAKCIIGVDYPRSIVNHAETSRLNIERMKQIYQQLSRYRGLCKDPLPPLASHSPREDET